MKTAVGALSPPVAVVEWQVEWSALPSAPVAQIMALPAVVLPEPTLCEKVIDGLDTWAVRVWLSVAALWMLWRVMGVVLGLRALKRRAGPPPAHVVRMGAEIGLPPQTRYRLVEGLGSPMLTGWRKPVIWLPAEAAAWDAARVDAVLRHEAAHWRRGDWVWQWLAQAAVCLWWWQPLVWLAARRLRLETEHAADDLAVNGAGQAADYARTLVEIAAGLPTNMRGGLGVTMFGNDEVKQRVQALMRANRWRGRIGFGALLTLAAVTVALGILVATKVEFSPHKPVYQSTARLVAGGSVAMASNADWRDQMQDFYGTIIETVESELMRNKALERVRALHPNLVESAVDVRVAQAKNAAIFSVVATGADATFTKAFLDALLDEYVAFRQNLHQQTQGKAVTTFLQETAKQREIMEEKLTELGAFQAKHGLTQANTGSRVATEQLLSLSRQMLEIRASLAELQMEAANIPAHIAEAEAHATAAQPLTTAQDEYLKASNGHRAKANKLQNLLRTHKPDHPDIDLAQAHANLAKAELDEAEGTVRNHLQLRQARLERQLTLLLQVAEAEERRDVERSTAAIQWDQLRMQAETARHSYEKMMTGAETLSKATDTRTDYVAIMERATTAKLLPKQDFLPVWKLWKQEPAKSTAASN